MKFLGPKVKKSRSLGIALTPKAAKVMERKPYPPGQHGLAQKRAKKSDYAVQLLEKQRLRFQYNVHERQMRTYLKKAVSRSGNTGVQLVQILESRLDAFVLRAGFAKTIYAARQYVRHRHILVNGRRVDVPGYLLRVNDIVSIRPASRKLQCFHETLGGGATAPPYIEVSKAEMTARLLSIPSLEEIPIICNVNLVIEYYSR